MDIIVIAAITAGTLIAVPFFLLVLTLLTGCGPIWWKNCNARFIRTFKNKKRPFEYTLIDDCVILGALPRTEAHLLELKNKHNVSGIVTLNMSWELIMQPEDVIKAGMESLLISTPDYCAPLIKDCIKGVEFIEKCKANNEGSRVYVHCNAGKGRSTTVVLCYLMKTKGWTIYQAFDDVKDKRPHIANLKALCETRPQWLAVKQYYKMLQQKTCVKKTSRKQKVIPEQ
jgi:atypical dual specificity phosphatase